MAENVLPQRLFKSGCELERQKQVNCYFEFHWIRLINNALDEEHKVLLAESQFRNIMQMGKHTSCASFLHYLLTRQLNTTMNFELWWTFSGKPIRYAIEDFSLVTGLNCNPASQTLAANCGIRKEKRRRNRLNGKIWKSLFGNTNPTTTWILDKLISKKCKDPLQRFRLALVLLVEGILCPTDGVYIRPEVVEMLDNIDQFLKYPWGRESFILTVQSVKTKVPFNYASERKIVLQGFPHAMILVTVCSCPAIIGHPNEEEEEISVEDVLQRALAMNLNINVSTAKTLDHRGQAKVNALLVKDRWEESLRFVERPDLAFDNMLALIAQDYPFKLNTWTGGVTEDEAKLQEPSSQEDTELTDETLIEGAGDAIEELKIEVKDLRGEVIKDLGVLKGPVKNLGGGWYNRGNEMENLSLQCPTINLRTTPNKDNDQKNIYGTPRHGTTEILSVPPPVHTMPPPVFTMPPLHVTIPSVTDLSIQTDMEPAPALTMPPPALPTSPLHGTTEEVAHPPSSSILDNGGRKNARSRNDVLVLIRKRKVRITEGASLYSLCRSWLRNGAHEGIQKQQSDTMTCLPKPLPADVVETSLPKDSVEEPSREEDKEDEESVKQLSDSDILKRHVDRAKKVRARLREERLKRIARYKARLALLLPPSGEQCRND